MHIIKLGIQPVNTTGFEKQNFKFQNTSSEGNRKVLEPLL